jgi:hypothetical protein
LSRYIISRIFPEFGPCSSPLHFAREPIVGISCFLQTCDIKHQTTKRASADGRRDSVETTVASDFVLPGLSQAAELHEATLAEARQREAKAKEQLQSVLKTTASEKADFKVQLRKKLNSQKSKYDEAL